MTARETAEGSEPRRRNHHQNTRQPLKSFRASQGGTSGKDLPASAGDIRDVGLIPESGRSPGGGHGNPLQYSCLENPMDRGAWRDTVHVVAKSLERLSMHACEVLLLWRYLSRRIPSPLPDLRGMLFSLLLGPWDPQIQEPQPHPRPWSKP